MKPQEPRSQGDRAQDDKNADRAQHGPRTEVSWEDGAGRQPYANQGDEEAGPATGDDFEAGDRGEASGRTREQLEQVRKIP